jgi:putative membrane-bound dehydrogenase-like protein
MRSFLIALALLTPSIAAAQEFKIDPPKSPAESLKCIKVRPGFRVELMVAEPLVMDPIAFAFGPDGKLWVVEMGDYPLGVDGKNKPGGKIKYLEKTKPDGPYDKMTVFMDGLNFPTGVFPYRKGILVTCAPDIFYAEATKGTGKADKKEVLFTGFKEGNQQHRVNGLTWGIDNWIYGANGDSGGVIKSLKTGKTVDIRGRDFRLKPETGEFEAVTGQSQFGRCRDDWGNWFGCNNSNPMFHFVLDDHYLKRNPHVLYPDPRVNVSITPGASQVFPISKPLARFNSPQALNHFTSACSTIIYRDTLFGKAFEGNAFISEPVHNLIHREIMKPKGVTFTSQRADDEQTSEFLASSDNWFRPTMIQVGPDGALWIADMYRYVIEHPEWIPKDWQKKLDLRAGHDLGRIYRVVPVDAKPRDVVRMDKLKPLDLIKKFESESSWERDTAAQLLQEMTAANWKISLDISKAIEDMASKSKSPQGRLHALYYPSNLLAGWWDAKYLTGFFNDPHPAIRKHALVMWEAALPRVGLRTPELLEKDPDSQVRLQLAYSLGIMSICDAPRWASFLTRNADEPYITAAGLSSISKETWPDLREALLKSKKMPVPIFASVVRLARGFGAHQDLGKFFVHQLGSAEVLPKMEQMEMVASVLDGLDKSGVGLEKYLVGSDNALVQQRLKDLYSNAVKIVQDPNSATNEKLVAIRLLSRGLGNDRDDYATLESLLSPRTPHDAQSAAIRQIAQTFDPRVPIMLLRSWKSYSPTIRNQVLDSLLARPIWTHMVLDAIRKKDVLPNEIDAIRRQRFLQHKEAQVREEAAKIFASATNPDRRKITDLYWLQLPARADAANGAKLFAKSCATCHKLGDIGQNVGPDFASIGDKSPQGLLTAILDPNRAVEARYINYVASTKKGLIVTGILTSETSTSITLTANDGKQHQLLRNEIDELSSTGQSMMPEGLEKDLSPQDLADVIEHIRSNLPMAKRKQFPGNEPRTIMPGKDGRVHLLPASAAVFGSSLVLEKQYGNLGYWSKPDDEARWTVDLAKETTFSVWLDFACAADSAGNVLTINAGTEKLKYTVQSTGSWDAYQLQSIGPLRLPAGRSEIVLRGDGAIRGALIDLKAVELRPR